MWESGASTDSLLAHSLFLRVVQGATPFVVPHIVIILGALVLHQPLSGSGGNLYLVITGASLEDPCLHGTDGPLLVTITTYWLIVTSYFRR